jgi:hypothetical protein
MEITCNELWRNWMISSPDNPLVIQAKAKISAYSKDDWEIMSNQATEMVHSLGYLVKNNIPVESELARSAFYELIDHLDKWFFTPNIFYLLQLTMVIEKEIKYKIYFNQFQDGLADYMPNLITAYYKEILN